MRMVPSLITLVACTQATPAPKCPTTASMATARFSARGRAKLHPKLAKDLPQTPGGFTMHLVVEVDLAHVDRARLTAMGAYRISSAAIAKRGEYGIDVKEIASVSDEPDALLVEAPAEIVGFIAELPWVRTLASATSWFAGVGPPEIQKRIDTSLASALSTHGAERLRMVEFLARSQGCLDDDRKQDLANLGAFVTGEFTGQCTTIFGIAAPLGSVVEIASLPWFVFAESGGHYQLEGSKND